MKEHRRFKEGNLVWLHLRKDIFPTLRRNKLYRRVAGPFKIIQKIGEHPYQLDLRAEYGIATTFNMGDLAIYQGEEAGQQELKTILSKEGGGDPNIGTCDHAQTQDSTNLTNSSSSNLNKEEEVTVVLHGPSIPGSRHNLHIFQSDSSNK